MRSFYKQFNVVLLVLLLALAPQILLAQGPVKGRVIDEKKQPLPGVSVLIKGTTTGTTTDPDGQFTLTASPTNVLVFHFVGFISQEVTVSSQQNLLVALQPDVQQLNEVVVTALGVKKETRKIGYAVQEVNGEVSGYHHYRDQ